jgi:hypothetical protein
MSCYEVAFMDAQCEVDIEPYTEALAPEFVARMAIVDDNGRRRPLFRAPGVGAEVHAATEALALSMAMSYLERHFGSLSQTPHGCTPGPAPIGEPVVIEEDTSIA